MRCDICHKTIQGAPVVLEYIGPLKSRHNPLTCTRTTNRCEKCHRATEAFNRTSRLRFVDEQLALLTGLEAKHGTVLFADARRKFEVERDALVGGAQ